MKNNPLPTPEPPPIQLEIPPSSLDLGLGSSSKNRRRSWGNRHPVKSGILWLVAIAVIIVIGWLADCRLNPEVHSQSLSQGWHQLSK